MVDATSARARASKPALARGGNRALFAGHEVGAEKWALLSSLVATCKLNDVNPVAYIAETLMAILDGHPNIAIEDLMPWTFPNSSSPTHRGSVYAGCVPTLARLVLISWQARFRSVPAARTVPRRPLPSNHSMAIWVP